MKLIECQQLSPEWFEARRAIPTASNFGRILTPKTMKLSASADEYIAELIAERFHLGPLSDLAGTPSKAMLNGIACEPEARRFYCAERDCDVQQIGFCVTDDGRFGSSPDGLVGKDGCLELKCPQGKAQVQYLLDGVLPAEYRGQVHGHLIVTGRKWCDFLSYCPGLPPLLVRVEPDPYTLALGVALDAFWTRYQQLLGMIRETAD